jgi:hypothetical protein
MVCLSLLAIQTEFPDLSARPMREKRGALPRTGVYRTIEGACDQISWHLRIHAVAAKIRSVSLFAAVSVTEACG